MIRIDIREHMEIATRVSEDGRVFALRVRDRHGEKAFVGSLPSVRTRNTDTRGRERTPVRWARLGSEKQQRRPVFKDKWGGVVDSRGPGAGREGDRYAGIVIERCPRAI